MKKVNLKNPQTKKERKKKKKKHAKLHSLQVLLYIAMISQIDVENILINIERHFIILK